MNMRYFYSAIQKMTEFKWRKHKGIKTLMFHHVSDDESTWEDKAISISMCGFKTLVKNLQNQGYLFITVKEMAETSNVQKICVTFDDIFLSAYENAIPFLKENQIPFCVFVSDCYLDKEGFITSEQFETLKREPLCTIGFHTKNHRLMRELSKEQILDELSCDDDTAYFAFPYGSVYALTPFSIGEAKKRYKYVFSTISAECSEKWRKHYKNFFPRINVCEENYKQF